MISDKLNLKTAYEFALQEIKSFPLSSYINSLILHDLKDNIELLLELNDKIMNFEDHEKIIENLKKDIILDDPKYPKINLITVIGPAWKISPNPIYYSIKKEGIKVL